MKTANSLVVVVLQAGCAAPKAPPGLSADVTAWRDDAVQKQAILGATITPQGDAITVTVDGNVWDMLPPQSKREVTTAFLLAFGRMRVKNGMTDDCMVFVHDRTGTTLASQYTGGGVKIKK